MKIYKIPENLKCLIFDIDGTLYTSDEYVKEQVDVQIRHWSDLMGWSHEQGRKKIADFRSEWMKSHDGQKISLGNAFTHFGIDIDTSIKWRNQLLKPENYLTEDKEIVELIKRLKEKYQLIAVTNNPHDAAFNNLKAIGLEKLITDIVGLDSCKKSKPAKEVLDMACSITKTSYDECLSIGDRFDIDLALPLEIGMGGVLVDGAQDLLKLEKLI
ncbi:HAD family hydrolase [Treponema sp.]|uniref:HAD family hydrolase n=1 Tax=Treponema sp. TaxID=166 RepID=UPI0025CC0A59|nr:HAD family hydrolase [Treponema sp.]MCR5217786.1 HAD family hydrolase [Treponema sp.]